MRARWTLFIVVLVGCGGGGSGAASGSDGGDRIAEPGSDVQVAYASAELARVAELVEDAESLDTAGLLERYATDHLPPIDYDPTQSEGYSLLQASGLALTADEEAKLREHGFVITARHEFPSFFYGYLTVYGEDLPVFVSSDSILDALHRNFDDLLAAMERSVMVPQLTQLLSGMRAAVASDTSRPEQTRTDAELFLAVAQGLLQGAVPDDLSAGVTAAEVREFLDAAQRADGILVKELFGVERRMDFSQFEPRGHYEGDEILEPYFRAMIWLGRIDFRMLETQDDGSQKFHRRQLEAALALRELMGEAEVSLWRQLDAIVTAFIGEHDYIVLPQLDALLADLGAADLAGLAGIDDQTIADAIVAGGYGVQRISSHVMVNGGAVQTLPLSSSFAFFGQRYAVDSHVFSDLVHDRVGGRWLPDPLDAAFAALGNDQAAELLEPQLEQHGYAPEIARLRALVDDHPQDYWDSSLYTLWLDALRALSPGGDLDARAGLPSVARTEAWGRRVLGSQLGSWSQLRHDTLLYVKQSYTVSTVCEFPDAYVDPYPQHFARIVRFAERGSELVAGLDFGAGDLAGIGLRLAMFFQRLASTVAVLQEMAEHQRTGMPHSEEHLAFINDVVRSSGGGSGPPSVEGWYARLFEDPQRALEFDPIIADVHIDPGGDTRPPRVLHVATGSPRLMVVSVETCSGPRVYAGPVFGYHELAPEGLDRITDEEWKEQVSAETQASPVWMQAIVAE